MPGAAHRLHDRHHGGLVARGHGNGQAQGISRARAVARRRPGASGPQEADEVLDLAQVARGHAQSQRAAAAAELAAIDSEVAALDRALDEKSAALRTCWPPI